MAQRLVFPSKQQVQLEEFEPKAPDEGQVLVRTRHSLMSTGTENIIFNRLFEPGTHWDKWITYPFYPGYSLVGTVAEVGAKVEHLKRGDLVACRSAHSSHQICAAERCFPVPTTLDPAAAAWFGLAKITFMGARAAQYSLGGSVLIIGAGPIGQMSVRWARAAGVETIIVNDPVQSRLRLAERGGATAVVAKPIAEAREAILAANRGEQPRIVIDSTGNEHVFAAALGLCAKFGRVVVLGDTGAPAKQHLTPDVITRGLTIVGAHDNHDDAQWDGPKIHRLFCALATSGRFNLEGLTSHVFKPADCELAYRTANTERGSTMGIVFDWSAL